MEQDDKRRGNSFGRGKGERGPNGKPTPYPWRSWDCRTTMSFLITKFLCRLGTRCTCDSFVPPGSPSPPRPFSSLARCSKALQPAVNGFNGWAESWTNLCLLGDLQGRGKAAVKDAPDIRGIYEARQATRVERGMKGKGSYEPLVKRVN